MHSGIVYVVISFLLWGLFPLYFRAINHVGALEILGHRIIWSLGLIGIILFVLRRWRWVSDLRKNPKLILVFFLTSSLMAINWGTYVFAIVNNHTIEASLGYFINPLVSVVLGAFFLKEHLSKTQCIAVILAALGVLWITVSAGSAPWIGLTLAVSWGFYGLIRKVIPMGSLEGLTLETALLTPFALLYFAWLYSGGNFQFVSLPAQDMWLLLAAGPITTVPLLFFTAGVRLTPYSTVGILQYMSPSIVFLIGVFLFHEPFDSNRFIGFLIIWSAVIIYIAATLRKKQP